MKFENLKEIPLELPGKLFRSPMPFARFDEGKTTFQEYLDAGINTVVMLVEEGEDFLYVGKDLKEEYSRHQMAVIHYPIPDFDTPDAGAEFKATLQDVAARCQNGENVAVHCFAGQGRTGLFIALLSRMILGLEGQESINFVRQFFPAVETQAQEQLVRDFILDE